MNKIITIVRATIIVILAIVAIVGIFSVPMEDSPTWTLDLVVVKAIGFASAYAAYRLNEYWA